MMGNRGLGLNLFFEKGLKGGSLRDRREVLGRERGTFEVLEIGEKRLERREKGGEVLEGKPKEKRERGGFKLENP